MRFASSIAVGQQYGDLVVLERLTALGNSRLWLVRCACGTERPIRGDKLLAGANSCGCVRRTKTQSQKDLLAQGKRHCRLCNEVKSLDVFAIDRRVPGGYATHCKACRRPRDLNRYRQRAALGVRRDTTKYVNRYKARHPRKIAGHVAVSGAVQAGRITRQPCAVCGSQKAEAHHDDYAKPLDVRWLCRTHHAEWHRENGEGANAR